MVQTISAPNLSLGWLEALDYLLNRGGREVNLVVAIADVGQEDAGVRRELDAFLAARRGPTVMPVSTVANTLFPEALYHPKLGDRARAHLYQMHALGRTVARRHSSNRYGTYFDRLVAWPNGSGPAVNQLERTIERLKGELRGGNPKSSAYELAVSTVSTVAGGVAYDGADHAPLGMNGTNGVVFSPVRLREANGRHPSEEYESDGDVLDLRIYSPQVDRRTMGFPCLSHISLTLFERYLHLSALYRNHHFVRKAYGNYLGLGRLLRFICLEAGCEPGEIVCVATHADAEIGRGFGKRDLTELVRRCRDAVGAGGFVRVPA